MNRCCLGLFLLLIAAPSSARQKLDLSGHLKLFSTTTFFDNSSLFSTGALGGSVTDARLKVLWRPQRKLRIELHPTLGLEHTALGGSVLSTGTERTMDEALPLSRTVVDDPGVRITARFDRASLRWDHKRLRLTMGRQPVSFGKGVLFTPLDLISPFNPATLDQSYKPGVDALRVDLFQGVSGRVSLIAAYLDDWSLDGTALALQSKGSVGDWEIEGFLGHVYEDVVIGGSAFFNGGGAGYYGDVNLSITEPENFLRCVIGVQHKPSEKTALNGELYYQSLGAGEPSGYASRRAGHRFLRGELWLAGELYGALGGQIELHPLVQGGGALIVNALDASVLVMPNLNWNVAENATLAGGMLLGVGERPTSLMTLRSEFGAAPATLFMQGSFHF